ncbi:SNF2 family N-terminal domain-containing protein [Apiospora saccharicola]|uniref:SNF2 family N-terminal domain-containing protein n=1 Tax=Apiospora saccharicola TaxID=335842 RepID=A0ABR1WCY5_9PEZI
MTGTPFTGRLEPQYPPQGPWGTFDPIINANQVAYDTNYFVSQSSAFCQPQRELQWQMVDQQAMRPDYQPGPVLDNTHHSPSYMNTISEAPVPVVVQPPETVCYGMILALPATYENRSGQDIPPETPVKVESDGHFTSADYEYFGGQLDTDHGQMMYGLLNNDDEPLELFVTCTPRKAEQSTRRGSKRSAVLECTLDVVVYGPSTMCDDMGGYFAQHDIYLQDPRTCHRDAKYFNPHKLSSTDLSSSPFLSEVVFLNTDALVQLSEVDQRPDLLSAISSNADLLETPQPAGITSTLKRHQKQALTFMLRRERGWGFNHSQRTADIWQIVDSTQTRQYLNVISGAFRLDEPEEFTGGIVADPMGLGKTLTMISLVATDLERGDCFQGSSGGSTDEKLQIPATLIIVPPPLLGTWEHELTTHVACGAMRGVRHHGKDRIKAVSELEGVHVVLTTYHTVSAESKTDDARLHSILFSVRWKRIILDEAHFIRNVKSRMAKGVCALEAKARWAVTGTPIQNRLSDFAALLQFIRVHPFDDTRRFDVDIANLWKTGEETQAIERLKLLSQFLLLRRPKDTIDLPARHDLNCPVEFTRDERTVYEKMRMQTITKMDEALNDDSGSYKPGSYMNVLQQIESLRLFCNLGLQFQSRHTQRGTSSPMSETITPDNWSLRAQKTFQAQREIQTMVCRQCDSALEIAETLLDEDTPQMAHFASCLRFACANCTNKLNRHNRSFQCGHQPSCPSHLVSLSGAALDDAPSLGDFSIDEASAGLSSKVQTLISDLKMRPTDEKCIVFSTWRLTLDMVQKGLDEAGISSVRFDGKVPQKDRQPIVERFKTDPTLRVMLLTLSCGAVGLTLTVANRAYLMEPHWNPTLEDQALARVHRLGQTKEVTTIRFYIRDSFEEKVMELQESKRSLAGVLLSPHDGGQSDDSNQSELQKLRALL